VLTEYAGGINRPPMFDPVLQWLPDSLHIMLNLIKKIYNLLLEIAAAYGATVLRKVSRAMRRKGHVIVAHAKPKPGARLTLRRCLLPTPSCLRMRGQQLHALFSAEPWEELPTDAPERFLFRKICVSAQLLWDGLIMGRRRFAAHVYDPADDRAGPTPGGASHHEHLATSLIDRAYDEVMGFGDAVGLFQMFPASPELRIGRNMFMDSGPGTRSIHLLPKVVRLFKAGLAINVDAMERCRLPSGARGHMSVASLTDKAPPRRRARSAGDGHRLGDARVREAPLQEPPD